MKPIALRFIHDMAVCPELSGTPLSGIGGIESWHDALEFIALGCENIQITTAVMQYGYRIIDDLISGTRAYLAAHGMSRLSGLTGSALANIVPADDLDRSTVVYPVFGRESCVGCGRCSHLLHGRRTPGDRDGRGQKAAPHRRELRGLPAVYAGLPDRLDNPQQTGEEARKMIGEEGVYGDHTCKNMRER